MPYCWSLLCFVDDFSTLHTRNRQCGLADIRWCFSGHRKISARRRRVTAFWEPIRPARLLKTKFSHHFECFRACLFGLCKDIHKHKLSVNIQHCWIRPQRCDYDYAKARASSILLSVTSSFHTIRMCDIHIVNMIRISGIVVAYCLLPMQYVKCLLCIAYCVYFHIHSWIPPLRAVQFKSLLWMVGLWSTWSADCKL